VAVTLGRAGEDLGARFPHAVLARLLGPDGAPVGILNDALWDRAFSESLLGIMGRRAAVKGVAGELEGWADRQIRRTRLRQEDRSAGQVVVEQGDATVVFGSRFALRLIRRPEDVHPDLDIGQLLTERGFPNSTHVRGALTYRSEARGPMTVGILQDFVAHETDAWRLTLDELGRYCERVLTSGPSAPLPAEPLVDLAQRDVPPDVRERIGPFLQTVELLGRRTAELHLALASDANDPRFAPEPFSALYQRSLVQSMRNLARQVFHRLRRRARHLPEDAQAEAQRALSLETEILNRARSAFQVRFRAKRIRYHGNYHLGRLLYTGKDFVILFFEGEPARPLAERRIKRLPFRDVASMLRSFHYVAAHALSGRVTSGAVRREDLPVLEPALRWWRLWVSVAFLQSYLRATAGSPFAPASAEELKATLTAYLIEKTLYEIAYEVDHRPEWARIPLTELLDLMDRKA
jgi:maltose alpha-D-glucosyltransferase/alpha-amylase